MSRCMVLLVSGSRCPWRRSLWLPGLFLVASASHRQPAAAGAGDLSQCEENLGARLVCRRVALLTAGSSPPPFQSGG